jgi:hypothetical protein
METIILAVLLLLLVVTVLLFKGNFEYKGLKISGYVGRTPDNAIDTSFDDLFGDAWGRTKHIDKKIRSILKESFLEMFLKETNCSYNEALNNLELKRYVSLLIRNSREEIRGGLLQKAFRNNFPKGEEAFSKACRVKTDAVMELSTAFITREWTLDFDRSLSLNHSDVVREKVYLLTEQYFREIIILKTKGAQELSLEFKRLTKKQILDKYVARFKQFQLKFM